MTVRRLIPILVSVFASVTLAAAQPKKQPTKTPDKKDPVAPAAAGSGSAATPPDAGSGAGSAVQMTEDPPPKDIEGRDENPDAPKGTGEPDVPVAVVAVKKAPRAGYPIEESMRPINLPANMSEVSLDPHAQVSAFAATTALRARYGITRRVQLGLTYVIAGIYDDPATMTDDKKAFHGGKAVGLDVTVVLQDWIGVRVGVPVYIKPVAVSISVGVPLKFKIGDKFALGGLDDLLNIKVKRFAPSFYQELQNAVGTAKDDSNTKQSAGQLRFTGFGIYNYRPKTAFTGRLGASLEDFAAGKTTAGGGLTYFLRAGVDYTPRKYLDLGLSIGFDDLSQTGSFGPAGYLAFRI
ncbi:MAG: hypothetical protein H6Q90_4706 [Deltaproteobacteria bacterium]|nr:hypothetical protein [Deltaproteobacteria bacterium]